MEIRKHKHLESKIWNKDNSLKDIVREMLLSMAWGYIDNVRCKMGLKIHNSDVKDIFLYGSITNYFYTRKSDMDMCILLDMEQIIARNPNVRTEQSLTMFYYNWAMTHHCSIYGRKIDISIEDINNTQYRKHFRTGAMYSLVNDNWIYTPVVISDSEFRKIKSEAKSIYKEIMHDYRIVKKNGFKQDEIDRVYRNIYRSKNISHDENVTQPVTAMYIAFRKIRDCGVIDSLRNHAIKNESAEFTLK